MVKKEENIFIRDIEVPPVVQEKADAAFSEIRLKGMDGMKKNQMNHKNQKPKRFVKPLAAAAACAALIIAADFIGGAVINGRQKGISDDSAVVKVDDNQQSTSTDSAAVKVDDNQPEAASLFDFSITAYAADEDMPESIVTEDANIPEPTRTGDIVLTDRRIGVGGYTSMLFYVQGDEISNVDLTIDKGELYSETTKYATEADLEDYYAQGAPDGYFGPGTHTLEEILDPPVVVPYDEEEHHNSDHDVFHKTNHHLRLHHCIKGGTHISESYDSEKYYGFYIPDSVIEETNSIFDLQEGYHKALDVFDGATLTATITFSDGSSLTKEYGLTVTKLAMDENANVTQEEYTESSQYGYIYGILAREK